ncbi:MAG TPA: tyrosine-type recombinase/integrase, partial [Chthonomonadaceae bacterium]|nr:tyrosine-type recombinase/integrase [Chthonomonadaceae bacterium]
MQKTALPSPKTQVSIRVADLDRFAKGWLLDSEIRQLSPGTVANRKLIVEKLLWFLKQNEIADCSTMELRQFLAYVSNGHDSDEGRWGNDRLRKHVRPSTASMYFARLRTLFRFLISEGIIDASPMDTLRPPVNRPDQIQPFTQEQVVRLIGAAKKGKHPRRDEAILLFLLDTGVRASELCSIRMKDMELQGRRCNVLGKGNKTRAVYFGRDTTKALWQYLKESPRVD